VRLLIVGDGPQRETVAALARDLGVEHRTVFTGSIAHEQVPELVAAFDVAVVPYREQRRFYFSPLKLYEYLAAGRPVVAADVGEIGHCIASGKTGLRYQPGVLGSLTDAIEAVLSDPPLATALGRAGRDHVLEHHRWESTAAAIVEFALPSSPVGVVV
jgi:glycosyltransferase involved in cell wall biosynthesis